MTSNAIAVANYFVDKANGDINAPALTLIRLVKYVYIAYGFSMSILGKEIINPRFDSVEAWKYGPVIPSVYHSFKHNKDRKITEKVYILDEEHKDGIMTFSCPEVTDDDIKSVLDFVWERYNKMSVSELIELLHADGTPWKYSYRPGENRKIMKEMTKLYYDTVFERMKTEVHEKQ